MRRNWLFAAATVAMLSFPSVIMADGAGATAPTASPTKPAAGPTDKPTDVKHVVPPPSTANRFDQARMDDLLVNAIGRSWAVKDAETQKLVDKVIADRKAMIQSEADRMTAFEKASVAARAGDEAGMKAATAEMKAATEKVRLGTTTVGQDLTALSARMQAIRPAPPAAPKTTDGATKDETKAK